MTRFFLHATFMRSCLFILAAAIMVCVPDAAYAYTLQCKNGVPSGGDIFLGATNCNNFGIANVFSGLNCQFQMILNEIIKRVYCSIQYHLATTLQIAIALYIIIYALMFTTGLAALTARELITRLLKIALIWAFAMNASYGVGLVWYFFSSSIEYLVNLVLNVFDPGISARGFFYRLDNILYNQLTGNMSTLGYGLMGFIVTLIGLQPGVFLLFLTFFLTVITALMRALISYLLGLAAIAFLLALGPIFVSLALFRTTYTFFDSWLKYLVSFALQIILIFSVVSMWLYVMSLFGNFFYDLALHIVPYAKVHSTGSFAFFKNTWAICYSGGQYDSTNNVMSSLCNDATEKPWPPTAYAANAQFIQYLSGNLIALGIVVYAFDALLKVIPDLARQLSGPKFAPQLGGGGGPFGQVSMPGFTSLGYMKQTMMVRGYQSVIGGLGNIQDQFANNMTTDSKDGQAFKPPKDPKWQTVDAMRKSVGKRKK